MDIYVGGFDSSKVSLRCFKGGDRDRRLAAMQSRHAFLWESTSMCSFPTRKWGCQRAGRRREKSSGLNHSSTLDRN